MTGANKALVAVAVALPFGSIAALTFWLLCKYTNVMDGIMGYKRTSQKGFDLIKLHEGYSGSAYKCSAGVWTLGYGHTASVKEGDTCTVAQAEQWLKEDVRMAENAVNAEGLKLTQNQFDALVSFTYNVGAAAFKSSTLLRKIKADPDDPAIAQEFARWTYAAGQQVAGLANRRQSESNLYFA